MQALNAETVQAARKQLEAMTPEQRRQLLSEMRFGLGQAISEEEFQAMRTRAGSAQPRVMGQVNLDGLTPKQKLQDKLKQARLARSGKQA